MAARVAGRTGAMRIESAASSAWEEVGHRGEASERAGAAFSISHEIIRALSFAAGNSRQRHDEASSAPPRPSLSTWITLPLSARRHEQSRSRS